MPGALIEDRRDRQFYAGRGAGAANEQDRTADSWSQIPDAKQVFRHPGRGVPAFISVLVVWATVPSCTVVLGRFLGLGALASLPASTHPHNHSVTRRQRGSTRSAASEDAGNKERLSWF